MRVPRWWPAALLTLAVAAGTLLSNGVTTLDVLAYAAYWLLVILLPGLVVWTWLWRLIQRTSPSSGEQTWLENVVCGAVIGYSLELPAYALARWLDVPRAYVVLQAVILLSWLARRPWRRMQRPRPSTWSAAPSLTLAAALGYTSVWLGMRAMPLASFAADGRFADLDDPFQLALIGELRHHFPAVYPYAVDEPLNYQFFYHLHAAASTWLTGASSLEVFVRFDPLIFALLSLAGVACVAQRLTGRAWAGVAAAGTLSVLGAFDITGIYRGQATFEDRFLSSLIIHAPTQAMAFALVTPIALIALAAVESGRVNAYAVATFFVLCFVITGAKVTFAPMVFAGLMGVVLLSLVTRRGLQAGALALATAAVTALVLCVAVLFGTGGRGLTLSPLSIAEWYGGGYAIASGTLGNDALIVLLVFVSVLVPVAGILGMSRATWGDPKAWFLLLAGFAGIGATAVFGHGGLSQRYFLYSSAWFLAAGAAWGLSDLFAGVRTARRAGYAAGALTAGLGVFAIRLLAEAHSEIAVSASGDTLVRPGFPGWLGLPLIALTALLLTSVARVLGLKAVARRLVVCALVGMCLARPIAFVLGDVEDLSKPGPSASPAAAEILGWLREKTNPDDVVMTNAHCLEEAATTPPRCDNRHFWMSALAERRFLLEGWGYVERLAADFYAPYGGDPQLLADNDELFSDPTAADLRRFTQAHVVRWILVDRRIGGDVEALERAGARRVFVFEDYALLEAPTVS